MSIPRPIYTLLAALVCFAAFRDAPQHWYVRGGLVLCGMALGAVAVPPPRWLGRVAPVLFWLLAGTFMAHLFGRYFRYHILAYASWDPATFDYLWPNRFFLAAHILGGVLASVLGPFQFWTGLHAHSLTLHRWTGRLYVGSVALAGLCAYRLAPQVTPEEGGLVSGVAMAVLATVWLGATGWGLRLACLGQIPAHREWMLRSYLLTLAFVNLRWFAELPIFAWFGPPPQRTPFIIWASWLVPLALAELYLRAQPWFPLESRRNSGKLPIP